MAQGSPPHHARALIVEDEVFFAINLEAADTGGYGARAM
jgi:hypothetical protein